MQIGDKITGAGFISMLLLASGLDGPYWKICLLLVIASLVVMCIGQQIKKSAGRQPVCGQRKINISSLL